MDNLQAILNQIKSQTAVSEGHKKRCDWAFKSIFTFDPDGHYYWIVFTKEAGFAYKRISPVWISYYANLILSSPHIFVEWNKCREITNWSSEQPKSKPCHGGC